MEMNEIGRREHLFLSIPLKPQIFILPEIGWIGGNTLDLIIFLLKLPKHPIYSTFYFKIGV